MGAPAATAPAVAGTVAELLAPISPVTAIEVAVAAPRAGVVNAVEAGSVVVPVTVSAPVKETSLAVLSPLYLTTGMWSSSKTAMFLYFNPLRSSLVKGQTYKRNMLDGDFRHRLTILFLLVDITEYRDTLS